MRNHGGTPHNNSSISIDTYHRRKPAPAMPDCGHDPRSQLKPTHSEPKVSGDAKFWHSLTSSVHALQLPSKCPPPQIQLLGLLLDLKIQQRWDWPNLPHYKHVEKCILDSKSMGATTAAPWLSSPDVRPTSTSVPEQTRAQGSLNSGWQARSPDESSSETNEPHDAFFMKRRALSTSLWKIWVATIWIQQIKS